ncbi:MAG: hypothetical protein EBS41_07315, partial [Actinobacteria bacterium]|nr:hypothetical protein [Actinomycetota bacterium]
MTEPIVRLQGVSKRFADVVAVAQLDLDIFDGEFLTLLGPSGSGKTTVGRELAKKLNLSFADSDELIEKRAKLSVREIFKEKGEPEFRRLETEALIEACAKDEPMVLAVAGGAVVSEKNRELLAERARCVVWLDAP